MRFRNTDGATSGFYKLNTNFLKGREQNINTKSTEFGIMYNHSVQKVSPHPFYRQPLYMTIFFPMFHFSQYCPNEKQDKHKYQLKKNYYSMFRKPQNNITIFW